MKLITSASLKGVALAVTAVASVAFPTIGRAETPLAPAAPAAVGVEDAKFFEAKVRPLLFKECYPCHSDKLQMGNLRLDSLAAMLKGNANGPVVVPGEPEKSLLLRTVHYDGKVKMPPGGKLKDADIAILEEWVKRGAPWPEATPKPADKPTAKPGAAKAEKFWSFKPVKKPAVPAVKNAAWVRSPIDAFVLAALEKNGLKPAPPADRRTLIRRAYIDLIGLPPTPEELGAFIADKSPNAYEKVIDRLLASPQYGERWGRHWLDVARYADSNGLDENKAFANAFRYRDYVVNAFNTDKPYNEFVTEQLAGDLMPSHTPAQRNERVTATGFLVLGAKVLAEQDKPKMVMDIIDEQIEVTSKAFMGLTVACARCHDHKFDPIPTKDYYALAGFFKSTKTMADLGFVSNWNERPLTDPAFDAKKKTYDKKVAELQATLTAETARANEEFLAPARKDAAKYLLAGWEMSRQPGLVPIAETPEKPGDGRILIEAENYTRGNGNKDTTSYGEGIGIIHTTEVPTFAEYDVDVPADGAYQIELRYASAEPRPMKLSINGAEVKGDAAKLNTGSFFPPGQKWEAQGLFTFKPGKNTIRLEGVGSIPHIDKLLIAPVVKTDPNAPIVRPILEIANSYDVTVELTENWAKFLIKATNDPVFGAWVSYAGLPETNFKVEAEKVSARIESGELKTDPTVAERFKGFKPSSLKEVAAKYNELFTVALAPEAEKNDALKPVRRILLDPNGPFAMPERPEPFYSPEARETVKKADDALKTAQKEAPQTPMVMAVEDDKAENVRIHVRGSTEDLGEEAPRRFLSVIAGENQKPLPMDRSGRLELAQWLTRPDHPLTSRVAVNRIWQEHFGEGLVRTPDNWGLVGEKPTHPELLDWLAATFVEQGWSQKKLHRVIMLSSAYRMSSAMNAAAYKEDPDNRLLWRMNRRRMDAEPFRDSILAVSGKLDKAMGGSLLDTPNNDYVTNDQSNDAARYNSHRRSIYLPIIRNALYDYFQAFDMGDPSMVSAHRTATTVAPQALFVMNSAFVIEGSEAFAKALLARPNLIDAQRLKTAYLKALGRSPTEAEVASAETYLGRYSALLKSKGAKPEEVRAESWASFCHILFASNEFIYVN